MAYKRQSPMPVIEGGTGFITATTAYAPILAGTTATGAFQVASTGLATAGFVLTSTGAASVPTFQAIPASGDMTVTVVTTTPYVVLAADEFLAVDTSALSIQINLPNAPATGRVIAIKDYTGTAATRNITVTTVGGVVNIDGATSFVVNTNFESIEVIFNGTSYSIF